MSETAKDRCRYCGGAGKFQIVSSVSDRAWATCFCSRAVEVRHSEVREALERQMEAQDEYLPSSIARERGLVWLDGWFDLGAALATTPARNTSQIGEG